MGVRIEVNKESNYLTTLHKMCPGQVGMVENAASFNGTIVIRTSTGFVAVKDGKFECWPEPSDFLVRIIDIEVKIEVK